MSEQAPTTSPGPGQKGKGSAARSLARFAYRSVYNPIVLKELRARMRGWRAAVVLIAQLVVLSCLASTIYLSVTESSGTSFGASATGQTVGQSLFYSTFLLLLSLVVFLSPAFTAGTISGERERKTLDLLITTLLPTRTLVLGKLISALAYIFLLILVALPIQSMALMFGGVVFVELLIGTLLLLTTALAAGSFGILVSSLMKSSIVSTVVTYATILLINLGLPIVTSILASLVSTMVFAPLTGDVSLTAQLLLVYGGGLLLCTNPFAVAVTTKLVQAEYNSLLFFTAQLTDPSGKAIAVPLVSPWVVYVLLYTALSALLIGASILILRRKRG